MEREYDVVIVGASAAGCTAAILFSQRGFRVALLERQPEMDAYKKVCTHFIQASALPIIEKIGAKHLIEEVGGLPNETSTWTRASGWVPYASDESLPAHGYCIRREKLDPVMRRLAADQLYVDLFLGHVVEQVMEAKDGRVTGVVARQGSTRITFKARLTVGADGMHSAVAKLANVPTKTIPNNRFIYWAYYKDVPGHNSRALGQVWHCEPDLAYNFPNDNGVSLLGCMITKDKMEAFKADVEGNFERFMASKPNAPRFQEGTRISKIMGMLEHPLIEREVARPGLALIGDAALTSDPLWGVGIGWALQAADWLVTSVTHSFASDRKLDRALKQYKKRFKAGLGMHSSIIADYATGRRLNGLEKLYFSAAAVDKQTARVVHALGSRHISPMALFAPKNLLRALWITFRQPPKQGGDTQDYNFSTNRDIPYVQQPTTAT